MTAPLPFVNFGPHGTFRQSGNYHTTSDDIDALASHIRDAGIQKVAIHFHGGLVKEDAGVEVAKNMAAVYEAAKALPLTVVWETGLVETFQYNLTKIHQTKLFQKLLVWLLKKTAAHLGIGLDSKGVGVEMSDAEIRKELARPNPFETMGIGDGARGGGGPVTEADLPVVEADIAAELTFAMDSDPEFLALLEQPNLPQGFKQAASTQPDGSKSPISVLTTAWAVAKIGRRVVARFIRKRDHGFYPTVVEEIMREYYLADLGEWVWGNMKSSAESMWHSNAGRVGDDRYAGRYLLEMLARIQAERGLTVDLVGHSAGAVAICHLLRVAEADVPAFRVRNVLLLAPAVRSDLFLEEVASRPSRMGACRVFTMDDVSESGDSLVPYVYTRSLLYFISGVLEGDSDVPLVGMQRYLHGAHPYNDADLLAVRTFLQGKDRLVISPSAPGAPLGFQCGSLAHGAFDEDGPMRASLSSIIGA